MYIISDCWEIDASVINEILNTDNVNKHEYILIWVEGGGRCRRRERGWC